jgi:pyruvate formate lyase activating enzyme
MIIGGFQKFSLIDYPGKICAVVFTQGCNFRCPYCHNPELVNPCLFQKPVPEKEIIGFLEKRNGMLEGITVTGGEPLLQENIFAFLASVKKIGYFIKLDTNGSFPERLERIIKEKLVDYIAMDVKASLEKYAHIAGAYVNPENIKRSIKIIMHSNLDYHFRTTMAKSSLRLEDIKQICGLIKGARNYVLQKLVPVHKAADSLSGKTEYSDPEIQRYQNISTSLIQA